ncbi:MAG TPA: hypothetical protein VL098_03420 [Flavipsychrobacter sp.]|nr:hypothetical protein [Flavipsychrobacter sp.]
MNHILIPTDFSIASLSIVSAVAEEFGTAPVKITLFHLIDMPTSISELLTFRRSKSRYEQQINDEFHDACHVLQNKFANSIAELKVELAFGNSSAYIKNYLEANKVTVVAVSANTVLKKTFRESITMLPLLERTNVPVKYFTPRKAAHHTDVNVISMSSLKKVTIPKEELNYVTEK